MAKGKDLLIIITSIHVIQLRNTIKWQLYVNVMTCGGRLSLSLSLSLSLGSDPRTGLGYNQPLQHNERMCEELLLPQRNYNVTDLFYLYDMPAG
jgi:hypothetical protein